METLHHNGVLIPAQYEGKGLTVKIKGKEVKLTTEQEEMAVAWAKKAGTPYVEDKVFTKNFHKDFSGKLGIMVKPGDVAPRCPPPGRAAVKEDLDSSCPRGSI